MIEYGLIRRSGKTLIEIESLRGKVLVETEAPDDAKITFTATTDMQSAMGKVVSVLNDCTVFVDTVWNNTRQVVEASPVGSLSIGDMVWVHEHLSLSGSMNILSSKNKSEYGDINFINLLWDDKKVRIDVMTGEVG